MCRYAYQGPYKIHYACFRCRKAFKQPSIEDWTRVQGTSYALSQLRRVTWNPKLLAEREELLGVTLDHIETQYKNATFKCPECTDAMVDLGRDFKAPRKTDRRAWEAIKKIYALGHSFHTCGCNGPGFIPSTPTEYKQYLAERRETYLKQQQYVETAVGKSEEERRCAVRYWRECIAKIDDAIANTTL